MTALASSSFAVANLLPQRISKVFVELSIASNLFSISSISISMTGLKNSAPTLSMFQFDQSAAPNALLGIFWAVVLWPIGIKIQSWFQFPDLQHNWLRSSHICSIHPFYIRVANLGVPVYACQLCPRIGPPLQGQAGELNPF